MVLQKHDNCFAWFALLHAASCYQLQDLTTTLLQQDKKTAEKP